MAEWKPGQLVRSLAGRDKGEYYLVIKVIDARRVLLANGRNRTLDRPKKKNTAHLQRYDRAIDWDDQVTDSRIAGCLKELVPGEDVC